MSHARPMMTQGEWDRRHHRQELRQRRNEIVDQVGLMITVVAMLAVLYFVTLVP